MRKRISHCGRLPLIFKQKIAKYFHEIDIEKELICKESLDFGTTHDFELWSDDEDDTQASIPLSKLLHHSSKRMFDPHRV
ncbi:hypothetical protein AVEN_149652-1 [Araneus ventricosus]|uniref:Uncharacterized protein n=1 Tax=Araneus ventricosus TaxID=182803 RepID=A0A4Y2UQQ0_ARAVE|nr:hypothetical protein AVEN_149652-1 [Araneus ventricosus]